MSVENEIRMKAIYREIEDLVNAKKVFEHDHNRAMQEIPELKERIAELEKEFKKLKGE
jgi:predicted  nucleic acid-binding Zn-ribbon protein